jgi:serine/threonine protein kinase
VWRVNAVGRALAYKVYNPTELRNSEKLTRFRQGYEAMRQLGHKSIVRVHSFTSCPLGFYMDYVDGPNLKTAGPPRSEPMEIATLLITVAHALRHAHGVGVIHRDIKPENIVMGYDQITGCYEPYVTDFDLAWFTTATQLTNQAIGALSYAAPEQLTPRTPETARLPTVDVYAFGQLAYFCALDSPPVPLDYEGNEERLRGVLREWGNLDAADIFLRLYQGCNQRNWQDRIQTIQECIDLLDEVTEELLSASRDEIISIHDLLAGIAYRISGGDITTDFSSPSGRTRIYLRYNDSRRVDRIDVEARFSPFHDLPSGKTMSQKIRQIDAALRPYSQWANRRGGYEYDVLIYMRNVELRHHSVARCYSVLDRVIDVMER